MAKSFEYRILGEYGSIGQSGDIAKKVRLVSYDGGPPRLDIRQWRQQRASGREVIFKGISLSRAEAVRLRDILYALDMDAVGVQ